MLLKIKYSIINSYETKVPKNAMKHYWSITFDELKGNSLSRYRTWVAAGKPKEGTIFNDMKDAKYKYKLTVRDAVRSYESSIQ